MVQGSATNLGSPSFSPSINLKKGLKFIKGSVNIGHVQINFDFRECEDDYGIQQDRLNREFTVNSVFMWIENNQLKFDMDPQTYDDLQSMTLRLVNQFDKTFVRDPRRLLRLVRFSVEKELRIEDNLLTEVKLRGYKLLKSKFSAFQKELLVKRYFASSNERDWIGACIQLVQLQLLGSISEFSDGCSQVNIIQTKNELTKFSKAESSFISQLGMENSAYSVPLRSLLRMSYFLLATCHHFKDAIGVNPVDFSTGLILKMIKPEAGKAFEIKAIVQRLKDRFF